MLCGRPASPTRLELPKAEVVFPLDWGLSQGMGWASPITQGARVVWSLSHQAWSCPSPAFIPSLLFHTGVVSGAQHQPLLVDPSRINASLDKAPPLHPVLLLSWPLPQAGIWPPGPGYVGLYLSGVLFQEWGRAGCHEARAGCHPLVDATAGTQAGGHQEDIPRRGLLLLRNIPTWYVHSSVGLSVCLSACPPWLAHQGV